MNYLSRLLCLALLMFGSHLAAEPLRVGVSFAIPPYVISHEDRGIELDLMREAFAGVSIHRNSIDTGKMRRSSLDPTFLLA